MHVSIRQKMTKLSVQSPEPTALRAATHLLSDYLGSGLVYTKWNVCGIQTPHRSEKKRNSIVCHEVIQFSKCNPILKMQSNTQKCNPILKMQHNLI